MRVARGREGSRGVANADAVDDRFDLGARNGFANHPPAHGEGASHRATACGSGDPFCGSAYAASSREKR
jgi:hypothetical protein